MFLVTGMFSFLDDCFFSSTHTHMSQMSFGIDMNIQHMDVTPIASGFGGLGVSALAFGTQVRGFKSGRSRRIFQAEKILTAPSFGREVKPWVQCR
jgi:hypothetical protein